MATIDILGIGNAIVDVLAETDDAFPATHGLAPGAMTLIDAAGADRLTPALADAARHGLTTASGGSIANACVIAARLGASVAYAGRVGADPLGDAYRADIAAAGVRFVGTPASDGAATGRCLVAITPDGQRTMSTFLGAAAEFGPDDLDRAAIAEASVLLLEGYLFDRDPAQAAFHDAAAISRGAGRTVALSLSDAFCVDRHRDSFAALLRDAVDIVFANEAELSALTGLPFASALDALAAHVRIVVGTSGADGSVIATGLDRIAVDAVPASVRDTTGAGDAYCAGFLAAHARGRPLEEAGALGSAAAAHIIGQVGARPSADDTAFERLRGSAP